MFLIPEGSKVTVEELNEFVSKKDGAKLDAYQAYYMITEPWFPQIRAVVNHLCYLVSEEGHSGFSIHYVFPFFKNALKANKELEMLDGDEYGNMIRCGSNELLHTYLLYKKTYNFNAKQEIIVLYLFRNLILFKPIIPVDLSYNNFNSLREVGDHDNIQNKTYSSIFMEPSISRKKSYYLSAIVFYEMCTNEDGEPWKNTFTTGHVRLDKDPSCEIGVASSAYIKKRSYDRRCEAKDYDMPTFYIEVGTDSDGNHYIKNTHDLEKVKKFYTLRYRYY